MERRHNPVTPLHGQAARKARSAEDGQALRLALLFFVLGLVAAILGFTGVAGASFAIAKFLFFVFLILCLLFVVLGLGVMRRISGR